MKEIIDLWRVVVAVAVELGYKRERSNDDSSQSSESKCSVNRIQIKYESADVRNLCLIVCLIGRAILGNRMASRSVVDAIKWWQPHETDPAASGLQRPPPAPAGGEGDPKATEERKRPAHDGQDRELKDKPHTGVNR